jgi:AraC-like DNA-binding protein
MAIVNYLGGFLVLVVALVLGFYTGKGITKANYFLMGYLLVLSTTSLLGTMYITGDLLYAPALYMVESPIHYLIGPFFYLYVKTSIYRNYQLKQWEWLFFLPAVLNLIEFMPVYLQSSAYKAGQIRSIISGSQDYIPVYHTIAKISYSLLFYISALWLTIRYFRNIRKFNLEPNVVFNKWLIILLIIAGSYYPIRLARILFPDLIPIHTFIFDRIVISGMGMTFGIFLLLYPQILYGALFEEPEKVLVPSPESGTPVTKYRYSTLTREQKDDYYHQLQQFMQDKKPYLNKGITLQEMAYNLDVSPQHLSQVVNELAQYTFLDYINYHRIDYAKQLLKQGDLKKLTVAGVGSEAGFNSRATFYNAFKKFTGKTPTEYLNSSQD